MKTHIHLASGLTVRDRIDESCVESQVIHSKKLLTCDIDSGPSILDLGCHIGGFAWWAFQNLPKCRIIGVDANFENIQLCKKNVPRMKRIHAACISDPKINEVKMHAGKYTARDSIEPYQRRNTYIVKAVQFEDLITKYRPSIVKCDIEGAEYLLNWRRLDTCVRFILMEFHQHRSRWLNAQIELDKLFLKQKFIHIIAPRNKKNYWLSTHGMYAR
jgi:FkbM family methyltransferase